MGKKKSTVKKGKENKPKNWHVKKSQAPRVRTELLDADYLHLLDEETLAWHNKFTSEYVNAAITKTKVKKAKKKVKGKKKQKKVVRRVAAGHLHKTNALAKECYDANNRRNNDLYGVTKINGLLSFDLDQVVRNGQDITGESVEAAEDAMIAYLDNKHILESEED